MTSTATLSEELTTGGLLKPWPFQREAIDKIHEALRRGVRRPAVVLPTGTGKTVVFGHLTIEWLKANIDKRVLILAHRIELIEQAQNRLHDVAPGLRTGIVMGTQNETRARVVIASVQTLRGESRMRMLEDVGLIIVDECHHATAASYRAIMDYYDCPAVGFTATMGRGDEASLGEVWQEVVYRMGIDRAIAEGWLVRPRGVHVQVDDLDLSNVRRSGGDYREGDLGEAIVNSLAPEAIAKAVMEHSPDDPGFIFAPTVEAAEVIGDAVSAAGAPTLIVHGEQHKNERKAAWEAYRRGDAQFITNCMVATEGTDEPKTHTVVIARPTLNPFLFVQMVGRALRLFPGKTGALVLDVVGATKRHDLSSKIELFGQEREPKDKIVKDLEEIDLDDIMENGFGEAPAKETVDGPLVSTEVDLFRGSSSLWLQTYKGVWFLPAGDRYIVIVRDAERKYDVVAMSAKVRGDSRWVIRGVDSLGYAMSWAEDDVTGPELTVASKARPWRARQPSQAQKDLADRLGLIRAPAMRQGEVSNMISIVFASRRIDPLTPDWMVT